MKRLVIILIVLLVVTLGGAGGLVMLGIVRNPFKPPPTTAAQPTGPEMSPSGIKVPTEQLQLQKVPDMIVPVILEGGVQRRISVSIRLVLPKNNEVKRVDDGVRKFQSVMLQDLILYFQDYFARNDEIDIEAIRKRALADAVKVYGEDVTDVLLVNVFDLGGAAARGNFSSEN